MSNFVNQVAFITGASSGIGRATALAFCKGGAQVVVADVDEAGGQGTVEQINQIGGDAIFVRCNVADPAQVEAAVRQTTDAYGRLDIGINNAGIGGRFAKLLDQTFDDWNQMLTVNLSGVFYCLQAEVRQMLTQETGGKIVNVSSIAGVRGVVNSAPYSAAKHGVIGLTKSAALEYVRKNIRINAICPVYTHTTMVDDLLSVSVGMEERLRRLIPAGRFGQPEDIAQAILWLCSDENAFYTGQALQLDGGITAG